MSGADSVAEERKVLGSQFSVRAGDFSKNWEPGTEN
jgi:hypothetical protein